jgi:hypothetical protein
MGLTRTYPIDTALQLEDGAGAHTSTFVGSGGILDLGAGSTTIGAVVLQLSALLVDDNNETYKIELQGSPDADFGTAANNVVLAMLHLGAHEVTNAVPGDTGTDTGTGVYYIPFANDFAGTSYRYVRLKFTLAGTTASITCTAFLTTGMHLGS